MVDEDALNMAFVDGDPNNVSESNLNDWNLLDDPNMAN